jgi:hypothetical protein
LTVIPDSLRGGGLKNTATAAIATAPNGRLIQKHHLHEALSVRAPPSSGPTTLEIPNIEDNAAMYSGRFMSGTEKPTIVMPPENRADAPAPATALPTNDKLVHNPDTYNDKENKMPMTNL